MNALVHWVAFWIESLLTPLRGNAELVREIVVLRHQLSVLKRGQPRPRIGTLDRCFWSWLFGRWPGWRRACVLVKPETVIGWHRLGFRLLWKWKSRRKPGGKRIAPDVVALIRRMASENRWGAPRIHGELLKLGFRVSERTVLRYMPKRKGTEKQRQAWRTFLENHREIIAAMDFCVVPTWNFRQLYILVILRHGRRVVAHVNVTTNPTAEWVKQQRALSALSALEERMWNPPHSRPTPYWGALFRAFRSCLV